MKTQSRLAVRVAAAALALSACGIAAGTPGGTPVAHASVVSARHAPTDTSRLADLRDLAQAKRNVAWGTIDPPQARPAPEDGSWFADLRDLAQAKRNAAWAAVERAWGG